MMKNKIHEKNIPKKIYPLDNSINSHQRVILNFSECQFKSIEYKNFNNFFIDEKDYIYFSQKLLIEITTFFGQFKRSNVLGEKNCHSIKKPEEIELINAILKKLDYKINGDEEYHQLAYPQGIRLIGLFESGHIFNVLFIDNHHLICPSEKYNNQDYKKYKFSLKEYRG